jgi:hypothetical protein
MYKLTNNLTILIDASLYQLRLDKSFLGGLNGVYRSTASLAATAQSLKNSLSLHNINLGADSLNEWVSHKVVGPFCRNNFKCFSVLTLSITFFKLLTSSKLHNYLIDNLPKKK